MLKPLVKSVLPDSAWNKLKYWVLRENLPALAAQFGTDKWGSHWYAQHYQTHFAPFRKRRIRLLEIGVGGYEQPNYGGHSLRMWKAYFPQGQIFAIDIQDKSALQEERIRIFQGSQNDVEFLTRFAEAHGPFDIIIDDGSHVNEHMITSFKILFPYVVDGGIYALEDLQTSYWPDYGGTEVPGEKPTAISMVKDLIDGLNWEEFFERPPQPFDAQIRSIHCYHNLAIIHKGENREGTNKEVASKLT